MKFVSKFFMAVVAGAGSAIGAYIAKEGLAIANDPFKRAVVKQKAKAVKETIFKKEEEES